HLQFRISDRGRYGVRISASEIVLYVFRRDARGECIHPQVPGEITHCPNWPGNWPGPPDDHDPPKFHVLGGAVITPGLLLLGHHVLITARGPVISVYLDGVFVAGDQSGSDLSSGRFGVYAYGDPNALPGLVFGNLQAEADLLQPDNFALLYNTLGY